MEQKKDRSLEAILDYLKHAPLRVAVFGEFSAGKSTFVNALIGEDLLSVAVEPTTAVPTYIVYAREFDIKVNLKSGEVLRLFGQDKPFWTRFVGRESVLHTLQLQKEGIKGFLTQWTKEGEKADQVENISIELPLPWLKNGLELVDTPGANNEFTLHQQFTESVARETDIAILLMDARQGGGKRTEFDFINTVQKRAGQAIVVLNKLDTMDEDDRKEVVEHVIKEALPKHWDGPIIPPVYGLSALARLDEVLAAKEPGLIELFCGFVQRLETLAKEKRGELLLHRLGNPEKELFARANRAESEKRPQEAHKIYFDLMDILDTAGLDAGPAKKGIERTEELLKSMVLRLDEINQEINKALAIEKNDPDRSIKTLLKMKAIQEKQGHVDDLLQSAITRINARIEQRDDARSFINTSIQRIPFLLENKAYQEALSELKEIAKRELTDAEIKMINDFQTNAEALKAQRIRDLYKEIEQISSYEQKEPVMAQDAYDRIQHELQLFEIAEPKLEKSLNELRERIFHRDAARKLYAQQLEEARALHKNGRHAAALDLLKPIENIVTDAELTHEDVATIEGLRRAIENDRKAVDVKIGSMLADAEKILTEDIERARLSFLAIIEYQEREQVVDCRATHAIKRIGEAEERLKSIKSIVERGVSEANKILQLYDKDKDKQEGAMVERQNDIMNALVFLDNLLEEIRSLFQYYGNGKTEWRESVFGVSYWDPINAEKMLKIYRKYVWNVFLDGNTIGAWIQVFVVGVAFTAPLMWLLFS